MALLGETKSEEADGMEEAPKTGGGILMAVWFSRTKQFRSTKNSCIPSWWSMTQMSPRVSWWISLIAVMMRGGVLVVCKSYATWFSHNTWRYAL